jgi:GEVED domain/Secretion system C-terminal sorting domain/Pregnancy-associated plasma protein-A
MKQTFSKRGVLLLLSLCVSGFSVSAQKAVTLPVSEHQHSDNLPCGTPQMTAEQIRYTLDVVAKKMVTRNAGTTCVPLQAHIVRDNAGSGGLTYETLNKGLANLNYVYKPAGIEFYWSGVPDYANNSDYYDFNAQAPDSDTEAGIRALFTVASNAINIYYVDKIITSTGFEASGYAYYPGDAAIYNFILMDKDYQANEVNGTFAHELGHFFNLAHTFDGTSNGNMHANAENVPRSGVNANCSTKGDLICDTQADPNGALTGCVYTGGGSDKFGNPYTPPVDNIMSYYPNSCGVFYFTPNQYTRIGQALTTRQAFTTYTMTAPPMAVNNPSALTATQSALTVVLNWTDNASNEMGYLIERSTTSSSSGFESVTFGGTAADVTTFTDNNVVVNTTYYYRIKAANDGCNDYSNVIAITIVPTYCTSSYTNVCYTSGNQMSIQRFRLRTTGNVLLLENANSGCSSALSDYTNLSANVTAGASYNIEILSTVISSSCFNQKNAIWIDANNDKDFNDAGESLGIYTASSCVSSGTITIPVGTVNGARRLRIRGVGSSLTLTSADACTDFFFGETEDYTLNVTGGVLSAELLSFKAVANGQKSAQITWQTASEHDVDKFQLQVSKDGKNYQTITETASKGAGAKGADYVYDHTTPFNGVNYYRLVEKGLDGDTHILSHASVEFKDKSYFKIVPNPTNGDFTISFNADRSEAANVQVYDVLGRTVATPQYQSEIGENTVFIHLPDALANGIYFVRMNQNGSVKTATIKKQQ